MIKLQDLAKACGCSVATVSKALSGRDDVSVETANRIREMAVRLHYTPYLAGRQLRTGRSYSIGAAIRRPLGGRKPDLYELEILLHLKEALDPYGYDLSLLPESAQKDRPSIYERTFCRHYDGIILLSPEQNDP